MTNDQQPVDLKALRESVEIAEEHGWLVLNAVRPTVLRSLLTRLDALEEGLKPFEDVADFFDAETSGFEDDANVNLVVEGNTLLMLKLGDFRRASTLLKDS